MKSSHTPTKHAIPFGQNGNKRDIPQDTKTGSGEASLSLGFPPETMVPKVSGGIPPSGKDFNGILNELSAMGRWANAGAGYPFDAAFANAIGGYPAGAKIPNSENNGFWLNTVDNNLDNPEVTDGRLTGWVPAENYGIATLSGLAKTDVTLTALQAAKARIVLTGDLKANVAVIFPAWQKSWTVVNQCTGNGSLICRTKAGVGVLVPKGESREIIGDGSGLVQRIVNASTTVAGITQLSSATDSDSETMAATPKAVKALAAQTLAKDRNGADIPDKAQFVDNLGLSVAVVPVGVPLPWPTGNPPAGWIACDGKAFDKKTCPQLAAVYPSGKTPDLRGEFIRGWDNGKNIDTGRKLLSYQNGTLTGGKDDNNEGTDISFLANGGMVDYGGDTPKAENYPGASLYYAGISAPKTPIGHLPSFYSVTRPCNIAFNYIVRAA